MSKVVVDSSVVIAHLRGEPGWETLEGYLAGTLRDKGIAAGALDTNLDPLVADRDAV